MDINRPLSIRDDDPKTIWTMSTVDEMIEAGKEDTYTILSEPGFEVIKETVAISENSFSLSMKISGTTYFVIGEYSILEDKLSKTRGVIMKSINIKSCLPPVKNINEILLQNLYHILSLSRYNPYLEK